MKKALAVSLLAVSAVFASAASIVNGSFEAVNYGGGYALLNNDTVAGGWFAEQNYVEIGAAGLYGVSGYTGSQVLELDGSANAKVSQWVNTHAGSTYTVSFDAGRRAGVSASSQGFKVLWNNVSVGTFRPSTSVLGGYALDLVATGHDKLSFVGIGTSDGYGSIIDNVAIAAVPEPMSMLVLASGAVAMLRRRRK
jgi:hypothetical protein